MSAKGVIYSAVMIKVKPGQLYDASPFSPANESKILELPDGTWMINARLNGSGHRYIHRSNDNGNNWSQGKIAHATQNPLHQQVGRL